MLRKALAAEADHSVVVIQTGFSTNLARLLASEGDKFSALGGMELVRAKVKLLSVMAGDFSENATPEYNVVNDARSAKQVLETWPTPVVCSDATVGLKVRYPSQSILSDYRYVEKHPLVDAYKLFNPPPHARPCWDPTSVLYAIRPDRKYFDLSPGGSITVGRDGKTRFVASATGTRRYLQVDHDQAIRATEAIVELASQPPRQSGGD